MDWITVVGTVAAFCTTVSYVPQLTLAAGVALWIVYGVLKQDAVIVVANGLSLLLLGGILFFKLRAPAKRRTGQREERVET